MSLNIKLSILDFGYSFEPYFNSKDVLDDTIRLVKNAEFLGYKRYWFSEHHNNLTSWTSPEMMIALLSSQTNRINLGTAGILINYHNCYSIFSNFRLLSMILPKRLDLGISSGKVTDHYQNLLMKNRKLRKNTFIKKSEELANFIDCGINLDKITNEHIGIDLNTWFLGTFSNNFKFYSKLKGNFCLSLFHQTNNINDRSYLLEKYREICNNNNFMPECAIAINCLCINQESQLERIYKFLNYNPTTIYSYPNADGFVIGNYDYCLEKINNLSQKYFTNDIIINPLYLQIDNYLELKNETIFNLGKINT